MKAIGSGAVLITTAAALSAMAVVTGVGRRPGEMLPDEVAPGACIADLARSSGLKAFPTADGFGQYARGGRGGRVYAVTTLADDGPGSLRACAEAAGPRTCVFAVSGTIAVDRWISVLNPYLTIAGQTSPGGIAIKVGKSTDTPLLVQTHDVVIRHLRLRPGPSLTASENVDTIQISGGAHDVILDHMSTSWPTDEGINIVGDGHRNRPCRDTRNVTVQWSILSEGLNRANRGPHSRGTYFGYGARDISFHHNLIANNYRRNPLLNTRGQFDMVNNVIYNSERYNGEFYTRFGDLSVNAIGNIAVVGPSTQKTTQLYLFNYFRDYPAEFAIYLKDNLDIHRRTDSGDERLVLDPADWSHVVAAPIGRLSLAASSMTSAARAYHDVRNGVGATRPGRDAADVRLLGDMAQCRGAILDHPRQVGGWPVLAGPPAPVDSDGDGIPDDWERSHGLAPDNGDDGRAITASGYSNLEVYLNALAGDGQTGGTAAAPQTVPDVTCGFPIKTAPPLPSVTITAAPASIEPGDTATVTWSGERLKNCSAFGAGVAATGVRRVRPLKTSTYEIHCTGTDGGDAIDSVVVEVAGKRAGRS